MTTRKTKSGTIIQVREPKDLVLESYSNFSEIDLQIEKSELSIIIREKKFADTSKYQRRLDVVEALLKQIA